MGFRSTYTRVPSFDFMYFQTCSLTFGDPSAINSLYLATCSSKKLAEVAAVPLLPAEGDKTAGCHDRTSLRLRSARRIYPSFELKAAVPVGVLPSGKPTNAVAWCCIGIPALTKRD
uniref:Uncharacterized protein n=1 Tax=Phytophthora fragariae TaxID=53985 RepID=A0A6A3DG58_9STRA|nr:hypothetical protein PF009_g29334 [Phytophthora fragariae]